MCPGAGCPPSPARVSGACVCSFAQEVSATDTVLFVQKFLLIITTNDNP